MHPKIKIGMKRKKICPPYCEYLTLHFFKIPNLSIYHLIFFLRFFLICRKLQQNLGLINLAFDSFIVGISFNKNEIYDENKREQSSNSLTFSVDNSLFKSLFRKYIFIKPFV